MSRLLAVLGAGALASAVALSGPVGAPAPGLSAPGLRPAPERPAEALLAARSQTVKHEGLYPVLPGAYAHAIKQAASIRPSSAYGGDSWKPVGNDALYADNKAYSVASNGLHNLAGRIQSLAQDPAKPSRWYAAVASGGVHASNDSGETWTSIGDGLPTQIIGAVAVARDDTLVVGSGDPAFGGSSFAGAGAYWSTDQGASWHHASGVPDGTITFRVAVDPTNTSIVYQATGMGLWRSTDAGHSYRNVDLPTTCTDLRDPSCFFANIVSDVVVRPSGGVGGSHHGGEVIAAVGWRAGPKPNAAGKPQAPRDGLYRSADGSVGSFSFVNPSGFPAPARAGRTALGLAYGPTQDHDYVYALVEDPQRFNKQTGVGDFPVAPVAGTPLGSMLNPSVLNGLYASKDFGSTWTLMANADQMDAPLHGSALQGAQCALGYCAGVQAWYNEWVQPSPAPSETNPDGSPIYLAFGLEEVWGGSAAIPTVPDSSNFQVFGVYYGDGSQASTVHPDQHAVMYVSAPAGRATLVVGNDGGAYKQPQQSDGSTTAYDNNHWRDGINHGMHTLLPYDAEMSADGTVWGGLQDNGELRIDPDGEQQMTHGGDGFFSAVDPQNSNVAYEEYTYGDISVTTNGGKGWRHIFPCYADGQFATPFLLDPTDAQHLIAGGTDIEESTFGPKTTTPRQIGLTDADRQATCNPASASFFASSTDWVPVFSLGTSAGHPNIASAVDTRGDSTYAGFCGTCDIVTEGLPFHAGLATNVGGAAPPKRMTSQGWHIAAAAGLPQRIINSVTIDPIDNRTVYVTLGGYGRRWIPPGALGDDTSKVGSGHVFVSHDAGETFRDISGDLPDLAANWSVLHDGDLLVANDLGVFSLSDVAHTPAHPTYGKVGKGLPAVPVVHLQITPRSKDELLAATYGRGVMVVQLKAGAVPGGSTSGGRGDRPSKGPHLAATGAPVQLGALALLLLLSALVVRRRRV